MELETVKQTASEWLKWFVDEAKQRPVLSASVGVVVGGMAVLKVMKWRKHRMMITDGMNEKEKASLAVLITGCDTGFGNKLAYRLYDLGLTVIATGLGNMDDLNQLGHRMMVYTMDITDNTQCVSVAQQLKDQNIQLWGIVNNAGIVYVAPFECVTRTIERKECDVLFHGHCDVTRAFLPLMVGRQVTTDDSKEKTLERRLKISANTKANGGRIVNISSVASVTPMPLWTRYSSMKAALRWWSHSLRNELSPRFGIWVNPILPGVYNTNIVDTVPKGVERVLKSAEDEKMDASLLKMYRLREYDGLFKAKEDKMKSKRNNHPEEVVDTMVHGLLSVYPCYEYHLSWGDFGIAAGLPWFLNDMALQSVFQEFV